jgi:carboxymethylenebutenolidase
MASLPTSDGPMEVCEAEPRGGAGDRAVIVVEETFGLTEHIRDVTHRFADAGYLAIAPEFLHRSGVAPIEDHDLGRVRELREGTTDTTILGDLDVALARVAELGIAAKQVGIVGFCWGGRVAFLACARRSLGAGVGFYSGGITKKSPFGSEPLIDECTTLQTPWLGLFGDLDHSIPVEEVEELRHRLEGAPVDADVVRYADAGHGFHNDRRHDSYHEASAKDGWDRALRWLDGHIA